MAPKKTTEKVTKKPEGEKPTRRAAAKKIDKKKADANESTSNEAGSVQPDVIEPKAIIVEPIVTEPAKPAVEHIAPDVVHVVEEKAVTIWGRVKAWKGFWWVVAGLALLLVILVCVWINGINKKHAEVRLERKKEEAKQIEVKEDTTLLQLRRIEADAINEFLEYRKKYGAVVDAAIKRNEYETKTMPAETEKIKQENIQQHEKNNDPNNSDDDVRRNLQQQLSKPRVIRPR